MLGDVCSADLFSVVELSLESANSVINYDALWVLVNLSATLKAQIIENRLTPKLLRKVFGFLGRQNSKEFPLICLSCWIVGNISSVSPPTRKLFIDNAVIEDGVKNLN